MAIDDFENKLEEGSEGSEEDLQQHQTEAVESEQLEGETQADAASQPEEAIASTEDDSTPENQTIRMPAPDAAPKSSEPPAFQTQKSPIPNSGAAPKSKGAALLTKLLASKNGRIGVGVAAAALALFMLFSTHIICFHNWQEPTCTSPSICKTCGRSKGDPLGHDWQEATCTEPKTCARCGKTDGKALGHDVKEWTVTKEATCTAEGEESGKCARCGETPKREVPMKEHSFGEWETVKAATCTEKGESHRVCSVCGFEETKELEKIEHNPGDWEVTVAAEPKAGGGSTKGEQERRCTMCGKVLETREYTLSDEEVKAAFIAKCYSPSYEDVARYPDDWDGYEVRFTGEVIQVLQDGDEYTLRVNVTRGDYFWSDTIMVYYVAPSGAARILEDDVVTLYGIMHGMYSYESVMGATITVPLMEALYVE